MEALYVHIANKLEAIRFGKNAATGKIFDVEELKSVNLWRAVFAEFLAQIIFVFLGCISAVNIGGDTTDLVKIALAFGLAIMAMIQMIGHVSGGHINPAVTIAMAVSLNISILRAFFYLVAQISGAVIGGMIVKGVTPDEFHSALAVTGLGSGITQGQGFGVELILTFVLVIVIFGTTDPNRPQFGSPALIIGLTVVLGHVAGIRYTGASMNPSRSLGSAVASEEWDDHWIYWIAPITGGVLASIVYKFILNPYRGTVSMDEAVQKMNNEMNLNGMTSGNKVSNKDTVEIKTVVTNM